MNALQSRDSSEPKGSRWRRALLIGIAIVVAGLATAYVVFTGPRDISQYPAPAGSSYKLPWPAGVTWLCIQGNRGIVSHRGYEEFAFDFKMPEGSEVCAARGGTVISVEVSHDGHGMNAPNNRIAIRHDDGTHGVYLHLQKGGSLVRIGDRVGQGQKIGHSGHVGRSMMPHLHFHVLDPKKHETMPISFADVPTDEGVPRMFHRYTSGNQ
jgi:murein DD-endopeptidase MepM/ murein hydrolase activator NlpD